MQIQYISAKELSHSDHSFLSEKEVLVVMPFTMTDQAMRAAELMASRAGVPGSIVAVRDELQEGFIALVNRVFALSQARYFAYVAQDAFAGRQWLSLAIKALEQQASDGKEKQFLGFNDGKWAGALAGFGVARRSWALQNYGGDFFYPGYERHFADAELTLFALQEGAYVYDPDSILVEVDWQKDQSSVSLQDRTLFSQRKKTCFDGRVYSAQLLALFN